MQQINYNETNGIIIGPEFSRIFAEIILQAVDHEVETKLLSEKYKLKHKVNYEIFRYVDDYFIFYNDEQTKDKLLEVLQLSLKEYKLYLNSSKALTYKKPIITEISRAKQRIAALLDEKLIYKLEDAEVEEPVDKVPQRGTIQIHSRILITQFKTIIKECEVEYKDMLNYSLSIVESQCDKIIRNYHKAAKEYRSEKHLVHAILGILEFVFFIYSVSPRVNTTIKLCRILRVFSAFMKSKEANRDFRHLIYKYIYDDICFILKKNKNSEHAQVETLYLLIALSELGKDYWLAENTLADYFDIDVTQPATDSSNLNYLSITVLLFYMREKTRYTKLRAYLESVIIKKFQTRAKTLTRDTELTNVVDTLSCPHVTLATKQSILAVYGVIDPTLQVGIINRKHKTYSTKQLWFTKWV